MYCKQVLIRAGLRRERTKMPGSRGMPEMEATLPRGTPDLPNCLKKEVTELQVFGKENIETPEETSHLVKFVLLLHLDASSSARRDQHKQSWDLKGRNPRRRGLCVFSSGQEALLRMCSVSHNSHARSSSCICRARLALARPTRITRLEQRQGYLRAPSLPFSELP